MLISSEFAQKLRTERPAYGTAPIRCGKTKCKWRGMEIELERITHPEFTGATQSVCPTCGCDSYMFMTEKEIAAWKRATTKRYVVGEDAGIASAMQGGAA